MTQDEQVKEAVGIFGSKATAKLNQGGQPEDQLRNPLEQLFHTLAMVLGVPEKDFVMVGEKSLAEMHTRPDFAVNRRNALIGFVEVKAPGKGADPRRFRDKHDKAQWQRLQALPNLIYTDGQAFSLWRNGELVGDIAKLIGDIEQDGDKVEAPGSLLPLFDNFLNWEPFPPRNARELAETSARLSRFLRDEVVELMAQGNTPLSELREDWKKLLFPEATDDQFADGYAQAVTFGLLMAKSQGLALSEGLDRVAGSLGRTNTLIGAALRLLTEQPEKVLEASLDTMLRVLDVVVWDKVSKGDPEAWLYFYEHFLEVYDNTLRKKTGSYYTPPEVVQAMVRLCDEALKSSSRFAVSEGLGGAQVHIADPAMGSGTFLLGVMRQIAEGIAREQGEGAVGPAMTEVAQRLVGFELQFGAFAVAQLRMLAEMIELGATGSPRLFVTDTLGDPYEDEERGSGIYRELARSRSEANEIKRSQPITVVIGNPPYKENAGGKGGWVEGGSANRDAPLNDWQPPVDWGVSAHTRHLRNLYVYFWRWASWKVFEQGAGGKDRQPPVQEHLAGLVCYITVSGFLNGPGFQKMRHDLRRDCDEIWVVDCSPERHQPEVATRIFQGVQHSVCIVLASRSPDNDPTTPAKVRYRALSAGRREEKFAELATLALDGPGWLSAGEGWRTPFLPAFKGGWADMVALDAILDDTGSGVMPGRTWVIAPDKQSLEARWTRLLAEDRDLEKERLFHPQLRKGRVASRHIRKVVAQGLGMQPPRKTPIIAETGKLSSPVGYGFRSFDRQWLPADARLMNDVRPNIWNGYGTSQVYLTAPMDLAPSSGPASTITALIPDLHHYAGRGGRVFALWKDVEAIEPNVDAKVLTKLSKTYGTEVDPVDLFAYVTLLLVNPSYTERFRDDLIRPGLRIPLTADADLFDKVARLGREVIWLHTFGERMSEGKPPGNPRLPEAERPSIPKGGTIPATSEDFPDAMDYDPATQRLSVGKGYVDNVPPEVWAYEVSGKPVLRQWFSYRKKDRSRPQIGDRRPPSPLGNIQPDHWLPEYTRELLNVLNVLGLLVKLEPEQARLLDAVCDGPLIPASRFAKDADE